MKSLFSPVTIVVLVALVVSFLWYRNRQPRFVVGEQAPDFQATIADGSTVKLSDFKGQYVLLQFWGSWCGPCRRENPELVKLYQTHHAKGFDVVSIGIDQGEKGWKRAIASDGLIWKNHILESIDFNGPQAKQYNIHAIPTTFLMNKEGIIVGVDFTPAEMNRVLSEQL